MSGTPSKRILKPAQLIGKAGYNVVVNQQGNGYDLQANPGGSASITDITYAALVTAIGVNGLIPGTIYKITDRGDSGLFFTAITTNKLSKDGTRLMLCPAFYGTGASGGNNWIGVWNATKNPTTNDLTIWGGLVWKSITGNIGTATTDILLDAVNWVLIPKASFSNGEYIEMTFGINYDVTNDWIETQWDGAGNIFGIDFANDQIQWVWGFNLCDVSDWNSSANNDGYAMGNNITMGIWNNSCWSIYINRNPGGIYKNSNNGEIAGNFHSEQISECSNSGDIYNNSVHGSIWNNSNNGNIESNGNNGNINGCSNNGNITLNLNNGDIDGITPPTTNIIKNINNGNIFNSTAGDITDTVVDK